MGDPEDAAADLSRTCLVRCLFSDDGVVLSGQDFTSAWESQFGDPDRGFPQLNTGKRLALAIALDSTCLYERRVPDFTERYETWLAQNHSCLTHRPQASLPGFSLWLVKLKRVLR